MYWDYLLHCCTNIILNGLLYNLKMESRGKHPIIRIVILTIVMITIVIVMIMMAISILILADLIIKLLLIKLQDC